MMDRKCEKMRPEKNWMENAQLKIKERDVRDTCRRNGENENRGPENKNQIALALQEK